MRQTNAMHGVQWLVLCVERIIACRVYCLHTQTRINIMQHHVNIMLAPCWYPLVKGCQVGLTCRFFSFANASMRSECVERHTMSLEGICEVRRLWCVSQCKSGRDGVVQVGLNGFFA